MAFDYVVVGAGIVGLSTAYYLKSMSPHARVLVIDKEDSPGAGDTARSAAAFRVFFTNRANILLSKTSVRFYRSIQESGYDLDMRFVGYLFVLDRRGFKGAMPGLSEARSMGLEFEEIPPEDLERILGVKARPRETELGELMGLEDVEVGVLVREAGILDPERLVMYYYERLKAMGVEFALSTKVTGFTLEPRRSIGVEGEPFPWQEARVSGVMLEDGKEVKASKKVIVATGAWSPFLLEPIGIDSFSRPKKRQVFVIRARSEGLKRLLHVRGLNRENLMPMTILPKGAFIRPEPREESFWVGLSDDLGRPFELEEPPRPEERFYTLGVLPVLSAYIPEFDEMPYDGSWAGHYDITMDGLPIIYEPYDSDLVVACGTSGSGIMKADAIGRVAASLALGLEEAELYGGERIPVKWLGVANRISERELLVI